MWKIDPSYKTGWRQVTHCLLIAGVTAFATDTRAAASAAEKAAAEALFDQGREALKKDDLKVACVRFEESHRVDPAVGTLLYLAECYERTERTASAWATFREAASLARATGQEERAQIGDGRAAALKGKLKVVRFMVGSNAGVAGFSLLRDGVELQPSLFNIPVPTDPGKHFIQASAPGFQTWTLETVVTEPEATVEIPALVPLPAAPPTTETVPETPAEAETPAESPVAPQDPAASGSTWQGMKLYGLIAGGLGVVGLGVGGYLGLSASARDKQALDYCGDPNNLGGGRFSDTDCFDPEGETLSGEARDLALYANVAYGVGAAALLTGTILYLVANDAAQEASVPRWRVALSPQEAALNWGGQF